MKLRTQFAILIVGIIAVPFLVSSFILLLDYAFSRGQEPFPNYGRVFEWLRQEAPPAGPPNDHAFLNDRPPGLDVIILGADNTVTYSTIPEISVGTPIGSPEALTYIRDNVRNFHFQIESPRATEADAPLMILKMPKIREDAALRNQATQVAMFSSIAALVFSSLMSFFILRSLNRSIVTLEGATRKISEGDLDFEIPVRGNDEISSLTRSFNRLREALKDEYGRRARFIMGVSHDLKTPLALIQGYVEAIEDGYARDPEMHKKYLSIIQDKTQTLEGMVEDLIQFVKMETGEWRMTFQSVPLKAFLTGICRRYAEDALILKREFFSEVVLPDDLSVSMDEGLINRALENLLGNAIRYTTEGGRVLLTAKRDGDHVELAIADTGIGIPAEELDRIYDPFYRGTNSRREQGFGLGLTTVRSIVQGHGWSIQVSSTVDQGTVFTVRIPM